MLKTEYRLEMCRKSFTIQSPLCVFFLPCQGFKIDPMPSNTTHAHTSLGYSTLTKPGCLVFAVLGVCSHSSDSHCQSRNSQPILDKMKAFIEVYLFIFIECWLHFLVVTCLQGNFCEWFYRNWQCWFSLLLLLQQETHCMCQGFSPSLWYLAHHGSVQCCYCFFFCLFVFRLVRS